MLVLWVRKKEVSYLKPLKYCHAPISSFTLWQQHQLSLWCLLTEHCRCSVHWPAVIQLQLLNSSLRLLQFMLFQFPNFIFCVSLHLFTNVPQRSNHSYITFYSFKKKKKKLYQESVYTVIWMVVILVISLTKGCINIYVWTQNNTHYYFESIFHCK